MSEKDKPIYREAVHIVTIDDRLVEYCMRFCTVCMNCTCLYEKLKQAKANVKLKDVIFCNTLHVLLHYTVCPRSLVHSFVVSVHLKWDKTT